MTTFLNFDQNQAYIEIKQNAENQGVSTQEEWDSLVEDYVLEKVDIGELDSDQDLEQLKQNLKLKFSNYKEQLPVD